MIGTKRRNVSLRSNSDDTAFQSKRLIAESPFGAQAVSPPQVEAAVAPLLDRRRAAQQHVRALNTEFASWVQSQLQDHPDELWEDGIRDYLTHASDILGKFTDVVNWLKANTGNEGSVSTSGTQSPEKKNPSETNSKEPKSSAGKFLFGSPSGSAGPAAPLNSGTSGTQTSTHGTTASSAPSWSFGLSAGSQGLSQSSTVSFATSWSSGGLSNSKSLSPVKTVSFSASPGSGVSSSNQTAPLTTTSAAVNSTSPGVFSNSQTPSFGTSSSFTTPWSAGAFSNSQTAFKFGNSAPSIDSAKEDADEENEPEQPSSPSLKSSEEKGIVVVHETKCKLYVKSTDSDGKEPWKDKGTGQLFIKCQEDASKGSKESKPRILVRNDVGRIMLNASLYPGIKTNLQKNAIVAIFHTLDDGGGDSSNAKAVARTFLIRTKNEEERNKLADAIRDHAPKAE